MFRGSKTSVRPWSSTTSSTSKSSKAEFESINWTWRTASRPVFQVVDGVTWQCQHFGSSTYSERLVESLKA